MSNAGSRGGSVASLPQARKLFQKWKREEMGWLKARILYIAEQKGEFHGDDLEDVRLSERNLIGAVVNALARGHLIVSTGEHRRGSSEASHGRRSYVYVLTPLGRSICEAMRRVDSKTLPQRPSDVKPVSLFEQAQREPEVEVDQLDVTARTPPKPVDMEEFNAAIAAWKPYVPPQREPEEDATLRWDAE